MGEIEKEILQKKKSTKKMSTTNTEKARNEDLLRN